ncbi:terpene synthase family protein [Sorangium sp. So ce1099]
MYHNPPRGHSAGGADARCVICWSNDIFSVNKESGHGDVHNLVTVPRPEK